MAPSGAGFSLRGLAHISHSQSRECGKYSIFAAISERFFGAKIAPQNDTLFESS